MADTSHSIPASKPSKIKQRSPEAAAKLVALGIPRIRASDFPLTPHPTGRWCKKLKTPHGWKVFFFGRLEGWQSAEDRYNAEVADLMAGRVPETRNTDGLRLLDLCNRFLHFKRGLIGTGELTIRSWHDYHQTGERLMKVLGKDRLVENLGPREFETLRAEYGKTWGAVRVAGEINRVRILFRYALENEMIDKPIRFGQSFQPPKKKTLRTARAKDRQQHGARMFTAEELRRIIDAARQPMKSMVLLAANGGLNNSDCGQLPLSAVDFENAILDFPRPKTGVPRRIPLWPETIASIKEWLTKRPAPKDPEHVHLCFLTKRRGPWFREGQLVDDDKGGAVVKGLNWSLTKEFRKLLDRLEINGKRNFLALRHGFRTVARGAHDREAVDALMGHVDPTVAGVYIEDGLPDERLKIVTEFVWKWLHGEKA